MTSWDELQRKAAGSDVDIDELKQQVDLVSVCLELGIPLEESGDRWVALCPFHNDTNPSFAVWWEFDKDHHKCGCWSCDFGTGDVFDLLQAMLGLDFVGARTWAIDFAARGDPPRRPQPASNGSPVDLGTLTLGARDRARDGDLNALRTLLASRGVRVPAEWLVEQFHVGVDEAQRVVIPHVAQDGYVRAVKRRGAPDWTPLAVKGSKLTELYGVHRWRGCERAVVVEGESDTWTVAWALKDQDVDVLGLPHGAGPGKAPRAEWLDLLRDKDVTLLFDADAAGRAGLREWIPRLGTAHVAQLEEGADATSVSDADLRRALRYARQVGSDWAPGLRETPAGLVKGKDDTPVANFTLRLVRSIEIEEEEIAFEVYLPDGRLVVLSSRDLGTESRLTAWANRYGYVWYGSRRDAQELMRMLTLEAVYQPKVPGTRVAGWHAGTFVFPAQVGNVGEGQRAYVPPVADVDIGSKVNLAPETWDPMVPAMLIHLHVSSVITPILGWVAAAPLRALCDKFPILAVVGGAGTGKTTLVGTVLESFGFQLHTMLTATTPHAVHSLVASTNSVPVWFDEYRAGARSDSKFTLEQVVRDAWDGGVSMKGGLQDNRQALTYLPARAPVVVSGEEMFSETSHVERTVTVEMPSRGKNPDALSRLVEGAGGFGRGYLEWLVYQHAQGHLPAPPRRFDRMEQGRAVIAWGWDMLKTFTLETCGYDLGAVDLALVERAHSQASERPIVLDLLGELYGRNDHRGFPIVWADEADLCVRVIDFVRMVGRETDHTLPGGSRAVRSWLMDRWQATEERNSWGRYLRLSGAMSEVLGDGQ